MTRHKVFISYHHQNDQEYKQHLIRSGVFVDGSVDTGDIDGSLDDQAIRQKIRDEYLADSSVTLLLVGQETKRRKHVDWEIYSSMLDGQVNRKSGVLVVILPSTGCTNLTAAHGDSEKELIYPEETSWTSVTTRQEYERRYPCLPDRIIDNLLAPGAKVSVVPWSKIETNNLALEHLIDLTFQHRAQCDYDLSRPMRRSNT